MRVREKRLCLAHMRAAAMEGAREDSLGGAITRTAATSEHARAKGRASFPSLPRSFRRERQHEAVYFMGYGKVTSSSGAPASERRSMGV